MLLAVAYAARGDTHTAHEAIRASLLEYAELFLFLLAAMTYINALEERNVFQSLRAFLVSRGFSLRMILRETYVKRAYDPGRASPWNHESAIWRPAQRNYQCCIAINLWIR